MTTKNGEPISKALEEKLIAMAVKARANAYCPYSKYQVGAAVLTEDGTFYSGCNIENASFGLTVCAERTAMQKAVSEGARKLSALAVAAKSSKPCGACRQVMAEFMPSTAPVFLVNIAEDESVKIIRTTVGHLLPRAFNPSEAEL